MSSPSNDATDAPDAALTKNESPWKRWMMLALFCCLCISNALFWVTYAPISDLVQIYLNCSITQVNMFATLSFILYFPGTVFGNVLRKRFGLKNALLLCGGMTMCGGILRVIATLSRDRLSDSAVYALLLFGQFFAASVQPFFCNVPPGIACVWFPSDQRGLATILGAISNPLGNALGQVLAFTLVTAVTNSDGSKTIVGMSNLMGIELAINVVACVLVFLFFQKEPTHAPSASAQLVRDKEALKTEEESTMKHALVTFYGEFKTLFTNRDYVILFIAFSLCAGTLGALQALIFQVIEPYGYTNADAGTFGSCVVVCGLFGCIVAGYLMQKYRAFRVLLKIDLTLVFGAMVIFTLVLRPNNYGALFFAIMMVGFLLTPLTPLVMELCAETTYPIDEDVSFGMLYVGSNLTALSLTFVLQTMIPMAAFGPPPFSPSNMFLIVAYGIVMVLAHFYQGQYKRMHASLDKPLLNVGDAVVMMSDDKESRLFVENSSFSQNKGNTIVWNETISPIVHLNQQTNSSSAIVESVDTLRTSGDIEFGMAPQPQQQDDEQANETIA